MWQQSASRTLTGRHGDNHFTATDTDLATDSDDATFTVTAVNDPPVVSDIPDQTIAEGETFATINLDDYVADVEDADAAILWSATGEVDLTVDITDRVATIIIPNTDWNGSETITFTAEIWMVRLTVIVLLSQSHPSMIHQWLVIFPTRLLLKAKALQHKPG